MNSSDERVLVPASVRLGEFGATISTLTQDYSVVRDIDHEGRADRAGRSEWRTIANRDLVSSVCIGGKVDGSGDQCGLTVVHIVRAAPEEPPGVGP